MSLLQVGGVSSLLQASQRQSGVAAPDRKRRRLGEARLHLVTSSPQQQHRGVRGLLVLHQPVQPGLLRGGQLPLQHAGLPDLDHAPSPQEGGSVWEHREYAQLGPAPFWL